MDGSIYDTAKKECVEDNTFCNELIVVLVDFMKFMKGKVQLYKRTRLVDMCFQHTMSVAPVQA